MAITQTAIGPAAMPEYIGTKKVERYTLAPATPSNPATGTGAGTGGSPSATLATGSSDYSGQVTVVTGTTPATGATIFTFSLANTADQGANYRVNITPGNPASAELTAAAQPNTSAVGATSWVLQSGATALAAATTYVWNYTLDDVTTSVVITPVNVRSIDTVEAYGPVLDRAIVRGAPDTVQVKMRPHGVTAEVAILGR